MSGLPSPGATDPTGVAALKIQEEFLRRHPGIELVRAEGIKLENVVNEVTTVMMVAGGIAPDVFQMNFRSTDTFVSKGMVGSVDDLLTKEPPEVREKLLSRIPKQVLSVVRRAGSDFAETFYGLPSNFSLHRPAGELLFKSPPARRVAVRPGASALPVTAAWRVVGFSVAGWIASASPPVFGGKGEIKHLPGFFLSSAASKTTTRPAAAAPQWPMSPAREPG
jgi:hypothetical protein